MNYIEYGRLLMLMNANYSGEDFFFYNYNDLRLVVKINYCTLVNFRNV